MRTIIFCLLLIGVISCKDDAPEPEKQNLGITGEWYSSGDDVAVLFRMLPFNVDSIYIDFGNKSDYWGRRVYVEKFNKNNIERAVITDKNNSKDGAEYNQPNASRFFQWPSHHNNIWPIKIKGHRQVISNSVGRNALPSNGWHDATIRGIFWVNNDTEPPEMLLEFVYEHWNVIPPNPEDGFGSSAHGVYGKNNVHRFKKIILENNEE